MAAVAFKGNFCVNFCLEIQGINATTTIQTWTREHLTLRTLTLITPRLSYWNISGSHQSNLLDWVFHLTKYRRETWIFGIEVQSRCTMMLQKKLRFEGFQAVFYSEVGEFVWRTGYKGLCTGEIFVQIQSDAYQIWFFNEKNKKHEQNGHTQN